MYTSQCSGEMLHLVIYLPAIIHRSYSQVHVHTWDIWITRGSISMVCFLCFSLFGHLVLSLGTVTVDTVYGKNAEARRRLSLCGEEVVFSWWAGRSGAHYLFPLVTGVTRAAILVTSDDCHFWFALTHRVQPFSKHS